MGVENIDLGLQGAGCTGPEHSAAPSGMLLLALTLLPLPHQCSLPQDWDTILSLWYGTLSLVLAKDTGAAENRPLLR